MLIVNISISSVNNVLAQNSTSTKNPAISNEDLLLLNVNLNRIDTQLDILLNKINNNNNSLIFEHAYIPHSVIYPSTKPIAIAVDEELANNLEANLTEVGIQSRADPNSPIILADITDSKNIINDFYSKLKDTLPAQDFSILESQTMSYLLRDASNSYGLYLNSSKIADADVANFGMIDYENTRGLMNQSNTIFEILKPNMADTKSKEIEYFITNLNTIIDSKSDNTPEFSRIVSAIENDLNESNNIRIPSTTSTVDPSLQTYYDNIEILLNNAISSIQNGNYLAADKNVSSAYLDNFEYLEAPIEEVNSTLMLQIETNMRENLRALIKNQTPLADIEAYISNIKEDLQVSKRLLSTPSTVQSSNNFTLPSSFVTNTANIDSLKQGFGVYTGERRSMGEASEDFKGQVRNDIDSIRLKLDEVISIYNQNDTSQALATARSAYLDSYENIEINSCLLCMPVVADSVFIFR